MIVNSMYKQIDLIAFAACIIAITPDSIFSQTIQPVSFKTFLLHYAVSPWITLSGHLALIGVVLHCIFRFRERRVIKRKLIQLNQEIQIRKDAEAAVKIDEARLESLMRIIQHPAMTTQELLDFTLDEVINLTGSKIGYIYLYNETAKEFTLNSWSKEVMHQCKVTEKQTLYKLDKTGVWGEAVRQRKPILINDFSSHNPQKKGLPSGHVSLTKFLTIPIMDNGIIVAVVGVANKETDYTVADIRQLNLTMDTAWKIVIRKQNEASLLEAITDKKKAMDAVIESEKRLQMVFEHSGTANAVFDTSCVLVYNNSMSQKLLNKSATECTGKSVIQLFGQPHGLAVETRMRNVIATAQPHSFESEFILPSGKKWFDSSYQPLIDDNGNVTGVQVISKDITEKQRLLETVQRTDKLESIGLLAGGIAHDFNNLLAGIYGYIDMAIKASDPLGKAVYYLKKSLATFERGRNLTRQLLTFSKGGSPDRKTVDIVPLLKESVEFALSGSNVAPEFHFNCQCCLCDVDTNQFGQVIDNVVINAVQAMSQGGKITVSTDQQNVGEGQLVDVKAGDYLHITFADNGIGISRVNLSRIFDPFFTTKQKGNGLGLATSYSIIKRHDGMITVESEVGVGTTFHIYMPVSQNTVTYKEAITVTEHSGAGLVLIIDDEECIRDIVGDILKSMGYTVVTSSNGFDAVAILQKAKKNGQLFKAVLTDLTIPGGLGGKELIPIMRKEFESMYIFVFSGYSDDPIMANPEHYGFTDKIVKPFRKADLTALFAKYLR